MLLKPAPAAWRDLKVGMAGHDVAAWQSVLRCEPRPATWTARWPIQVDGQFGPLTAAATRAYQAARRFVVVNGIVGAAVRATLDSALFFDPVVVDPHALPPIAFVQARNYGWAARTTLDVIVLHSAEVGEFHSSAEGVASYFRIGPPKPASAHYVVDDDSIVQCVRDAHIAFHAPGVNTRSLGIEQAGYAKQTRDEWLDPYGQRMLRLVARLIAAKAKEYDVPLVWLTPADLLAGKRGLCQHRDVTAAYPKDSHGHTDCGTSYPTDVVQDWAQEAMEA